jgi:hypothetical protein
MSPGAGTDPRTPRLVGILVPVRDEQELLGACLGALADAVAGLSRARPDVAVEAVVVLDGCSDGSRQVVESSPWPSGRPRPRPVTTGPVGVGAARRLAAERLMHHASERAIALDGLWLAGTDADSVVPPQWLVAQVEAAEAGWDAWAGTVVLDPHGSPRRADDTAAAAREQLAARWLADQRHVEGHDHVHGANLGVLGSAYRHAGGFPALPTGEDAALVASLHGSGAAVLHTARHPVRTSDRTVGRAPGGVSADLALLQARAPELVELPDSRAS